MTIDDEPAATGGESAVESNGFIPADAVEPDSDGDSVREKDGS